MQSNAAEKIEETESIITVEPELSSIDIDDKEVVEEAVSNSPAPVPTGIKVLFGGFALAVVFAILGFTMFTGSESETVENGGYIDPVVLANGKQIKDSLLESNKSLDSTSASLNDVENPSLPSFEKTFTNNSAEEYANPDSSESAVGSELTKLKSILDEQGLDITQLSETLTRLKQEELSNLQNQMSSISDELKNIHSSVNKQYADLKTAYKKSSSQTNNQPTRPPFKLLSIDVWGGKTSAVIFMQNKTSFAEVGDERAGWRIESIDRPNCIVTRNTVSNKRINVCMKG